MKRKVFDALQTHMLCVLVANEDEFWAYMVKMAENMKVEKPKRSDLKDLKNEILIASRIHSSGWIVYSIKTTTINSGDITNIEECEIEIK